MRILAPAAILLALAVPACATEPSPLRSGEALTKECADLQPTFRKYQELLDLRDWKIVYLCEPHPNVAGAVGVSHIFPAEKSAMIWIYPDAPDKVEVILHEMMHVVVEYVRAAGSELVEENTVRTLVLAIQKGDGA